MHRILQVGIGPRENLEQWVKQDEIQSIVIVEPHPDQVLQLQSQYYDQPKLEVIEAAVSTRPSPQTLFDYNLPGFSSLYPASALKRLFPGLQIQQTFKVKTLAPHTLLEHYGPNEEQTATLVIQAKGFETELIQELLSNPNLTRFTDIVLYTGIIPLYDSSLDADLQNNQLIAAGYELAHQKNISPEWVEYHFKRNPAQDQIVLLQEQLQQQKNQLHQLKTEIQTLQQALTTEKSTVERLSQQLHQEQAKNQQLQTDKGALAQLESRMEQLFNQQANQIQQASHALEHHVTSSFATQRQHTQALTGLQHYLEKGEQPLNFDAWSMSIDTLNYLVRQIEQNNYDIIIEFGSGTSTVVLAKAIAQRLTSQRYSQITKNDNKQLAYEDIDSHSLTHAAESQASSLLHKAEYDLPRQILSFEQDRSHFNQTKQTLNSHGVSQIVELVLAPLVPARCSAQPTEQRPLFYDAEKQLERLAQLFEQRTARILVIVDGPFSPKDNPLIREPALGTVLQYLSAQPIDILLDDTQRPGEQQVLEHWQTLCEERGLTFTAQPLDVVKGATWVTVRPE